MKGTTRSRRDQGTGEAVTRASERQVQRRSRTRKLDPRDVNMPSLMTYRRLVPAELGPSSAAVGRKGHDAAPSKSEEWRMSKKKDKKKNKKKGKKK